MATIYEMQELIQEYYPLPEWKVFFEVGNHVGGMGNTKGKRLADAIAVNTYRSKGHSIHGFEIKTSRKNLKDELREPKKSEEMAIHTDYWWLVCPKNVVKGFDLPEWWGVLLMDGDELIVEKEAPKLDDALLTRDFVASLLNSNGKIRRIEVMKILQDDFNDILQLSQAVIDRVQDGNVRWIYRSRLKELLGDKYIKTDAEKIEEKEMADLVRL